MAAHLFLPTALCALVGAGGGPAPAPEGPLAIRGYDPVAYFREGRPAQGDPAFAYFWHGRVWRFLSPENRDRFAARPERYAPQYDGYCAWALTEDRKAETDPEVWAIVDGKLYLNCSTAAYEKWARDIPGHIRLADANWLRWQSR